MTGYLPRFHRITVKYQRFSEVLKESKTKRKITKNLNLNLAPPKAKKSALVSIGDLVSFAAVFWVVTQRSPSLEGRVAWRAITLLRRRLWVIAESFLSHVDRAKCIDE